VIKWLEDQLELRQTYPVSGPRKGSTWRSLFSSIPEACLQLREESVGSRWWWHFVCVKLARMQRPRRFVKHKWRCCHEGILQMWGAWTISWLREDFPPQWAWTSSHPLKTMKGDTELPQSKRHSVSRLGHRSREFPASLTNITLARTSVIQRLKSKSQYIDSWVGR